MNINKMLRIGCGLYTKRFTRNARKQSQCATVYFNSETVQMFLLNEQICKGDVASQWEIAIFSHMGLWNPWTDSLEIWYDWFRPPQDIPCQFWWRSVERGYWANTRLVPLSFISAHQQFAYTVTHHTKGISQAVKVCSLTTYITPCKINTEIQTKNE